MIKPHSLILALLLAGCAHAPAPVIESREKTLQDLVGLRKEAVRMVDDRALSEIALVQAQAGDDQGCISTLLAILPWHYRFQSTLRIIRESPRLRSEMARGLLELARETLEPPGADTNANRELYWQLALGYAQCGDDRRASWALGKVGPDLTHWIESARGVCIHQVRGGRVEAALALARETKEPESQHLYEAIAFELIEKGRIEEGMALADRCGERSDWVRVMGLLRLPKPTDRAEESYAPLVEAADAIEELSREVQAQGFLELSKALLRVGNRDEAWRALLVAWDRARFDDPLVMGPIIEARVEFKFSGGDLEGAIEEGATNYLDERDKHEVLRVLGRKLIAQGKLDQAASLIPAIGAHGTAVRLGDLAAARWRKGEKEQGRILIRRAVDRFLRFMETREVPFDTVLEDGRPDDEDDFVELLGILGMIDLHELMAGRPRWLELLEQEKHVLRVFRMVGRHHPEGIDIPEWPPDRKLYLQLGMIEGRLGIPEVTEAR